MSVNETGSSLLSLLIIMFVVAIAVAVFIIVGGTIWVIVKARKNGFSNSKKVIFYTIGAIIIAAFSWVLNFGWLRFIMTFYLIPIIHAIIFFLANMFLAKYTDQSSKMQKLNSLFIIAYLATYVFLPDGGDIGEMYFFFGLIHNDIISYIASFVSRIAGVGHIVLFILQLVEINKIKKTISENNVLHP